MTTLLITRKNALTGTEHKAEIVFNQTLTNETIGQLHWLLETSHPDDHINLSWGSNFSCGMPLNMKFDETAVERGQMTLAAFEAKWYKHGGAPVEPKQG